MAQLGDLADDVVIACAAVRLGSDTSETAASLNQGIALTRALAEFESPVASSPGSLDAMSQALAVNEAVDRLTFTIDGRPEDFFSGLADDLDAILSKQGTSENFVRVENFFSRLAIGTLQTASTMMRPRAQELAWTSAALNF